MKKALITGVTGQDGSYLAEFLIKKGYEVHGIKRRSSMFNTERLNLLINEDGSFCENFFLHHGDLTDDSRLWNLINQIEPDEVYNLGAQSHVAVSFENPMYTSDVDALGTLRLLEAIRELAKRKDVRFYQASSSELYGLVREVPQTELTPFYPRSPYAVAKLYSYWITVNYRESYGLYACNGILFNHESPRRGETFVTRKITRALTRVAMGLQDDFQMGNVNALRDWGHARDYVEMQWLMLQQDRPVDYVIATGEQFSVRQFIVWSANHLGISVKFEGSGIDEMAVVTDVDRDRSPGVDVGQVIMRVCEKYFRPAEVETLLGDATKARKELGWTPRVSTEQLCQEMVDEDLILAQRELLIRNSSLSR